MRSAGRGCAGGAALQPPQPDRQHPDPCRTERPARRGGADRRRPHQRRGPRPADPSRPHVHPAALVGGAACPDGHVRLEVLERGRAEVRAADRGRPRNRRGRRTSARRPAPSRALRRAGLQRRLHLGGGRRRLARRRHRAPVAPARPGAAPARRGASADTRHAGRLRLSHVARLPRAGCWRLPPRSPPRSFSNADASRCRPGSISGAKGRDSPGSTSAPADHCCSKPSAGCAQRPRPTARATPLPAADR